MEPKLAEEIRKQKRIVLLEHLNTDLFNEIHRLRKKLERARRFEDHIYENYNMSGVVKAFELHGNKYNE